jgi:DNA primase catalytic core
VNQPLTDFIEKIPIEDAITPHVKLRKIARLYWGHCPFHSENTPSFVVNGDKKFFYCFGCGAGGNVINFLMKINNDNFINTVQFLSNQYHIPYTITPAVENHHYNQQQYQQKIIDFFQNYIKICHQKLMVHPEALKYLSQRNVSMDTIRNFNLGYDDGSINDLIDLGYSMADLQEYAVLSNEDWTSKFKNRIILPLTNVKGEFISIVGRTLSSNKHLVKYLHTVENSIFYKKTAFFNYHNVINNFDSVYIVEGFFDMLSCINHGISNVIACLGATISDEQAFILQKNFKTVNLLLDGDGAGVQGMIKGAHKFLPYLGNTRLYFYLLPQQDPAEYLMDNELNNLPFFNLEDFLWEYAIKPKDAIVDAATFTQIYKNIETILDPLKKNTEINPAIPTILTKYWNKKIFALENPHRKFQQKSVKEFLPVVTHKSHILIVTLYYKLHEVLSNMDQLSKIKIQEMKLVHLFNKIMNFAFDTEGEPWDQMQVNFKKQLNQEELNIIDHRPVNAIVSLDARPLDQILNDEYFS